MHLNLYRRHFRTAGKCSGGYPADFRNYESDEFRKGWKKCRCPIYADGTLAGQFRRRNTKLVSWPEARTLASSWEAAGRWDEGAISLFLNEHAGTSAPNTVKKYTLLMKKLAAFAEARGYVSISQLAPIDVREFSQSWMVGPLTASKDLGLLKAFFGFALVNEWINRNPARLIIVRRHYAAWVPERQERLTSILREAFSEKPTPKIVAIR